MNKYYRHIRFLQAAPSLSSAPPDQGYEVALTGRSNAGKSSTLNALTDQGQLARTSKTPGRTQLLIFFALDELRRLVDLPGYGYAKVANQTKRQWQTHMAAYLQYRDCLQGVLSIMDARHPLTSLDQQLLDWCRQAELPVHVLLNKADKLKKAAAQRALREVSAHLARDFPQASVQLFSARQRTGIAEVHAVLDRWLVLPPADIPEAE